MSPHGKTKHLHDDSPDTAEEFRRLVGLGDGSEKERLRQEIVTVWLPLAHRLAWRYRNRGESLEDLRQVAALGLVKAVDHYDPDKARAFEVYAIPTIDGEIKRHFRDYMWTVHVPRRVQELRNRVRASRQELSQTVVGRAPTVAEIARHAGMTEQEVADGSEALESFVALSLDVRPQGEDDGYGYGYGPTLGATLGAPDPAYDIIVDRESVRPRLCRLPDRERKVLYMRFFRGMTQSMIAEDLGVSQMHVSRLISRSCSRIRDEVLADSGEPRRAAGVDTAGGGRPPACG
jgi:RNA polymerase sigma-B factor